MSHHSIFGVRSMVMKGSLGVINEVIEQQQLLGELSLGMAYDLAKLLRFGPSLLMRQAGLMSRVGFVMLSAVAPMCK
ncbi:hypothetical protein THAOC_20287 [Thalassiosira oceanica]|uniref:Uncharacterized protein n=1 Tax=Thalassiosira oceanica TaxID=159749 RepID=K0S3P9_THAOC|nr:hypothetical protein THAOC_20287 [Thalassiosira oceanica]|eukprot:EJK59484.1 hypothetical protein THAOC_20287 [Thalassiosira oceanica]